MASQSQAKQISRKINYSTLASIVIPVKLYKNAYEDKMQILSKNKGKTGVYRWVNLENKKCYVGSSVNLSVRLLNYYSISFLEKSLETTSSKIYRALFKYGYSNF